MWCMHICVYICMYPKHSSSQKCAMLHTWIARRPKQMLFMVNWKCMLNIFFTSISCCWFVTHNAECMYLGTLSMSVKLSRLLVRKVYIKSRGQLLTKINIRGRGLQSLINVSRSHRKNIVWFHVLDDSNEYALFSYMGWTYCNSGWPELKHRDDPAVVHAGLMEN